MSNTIKIYKEIFNYIEFYNNEKLTDLLADVNLNVNLRYRNKQLAEIAVIHNNFHAFSLIINHPKLDKNKINHKYIKRILERVSNNDSFENRKYLEELYKINYIFHRFDFNGIKNNEKLGLEIWEKYPKDNYNDLENLLLSIENTFLFKTIFQYAKDNFENNITPNAIERILTQVYWTNNLPILLELQKFGIDIFNIGDRTGIVFCLENLRDSWRSGKTTILEYISKQNIKYNKDIFDDFTSIIHYQNIGHTRGSRNMFSIFCSYYYVLKTKYNNVDKDYSLPKKLLDKCFFDYGGNPYQIHQNHNFLSEWQIYRVLDAINYCYQITENKKNIFELFDDAYINFIDNKISNEVNIPIDQVYENSYTLKQQLNCLLKELLNYPEYKLTDKWKVLLIKHKIFTKDEIENFIPVQLKLRRIRFKKLKK